MADLLDQARALWEGEIDFEGQRLAELLSNFLLTAIGIISFLAGYLTNNITYTLWSGLAGTALTFLIVVPPWPIYNKHPVPWLTSSRGGAAAASASSRKPNPYNITVDGQKVQ